MTAHTATSAEVGRTRSSKQGFFGRIIQFLREVIGELKKVTYPTGPELMRYTAVVLVFVIVMMLLVMGLDFVFGRAAMSVFGGSPEN
ncbi:preprotein translocase subunit SecE [Falsarthrobacter nasiphocae]|uniref:Protein translocase subunit SecE n=1 Tax=Falsarthrobacter nasiphocae TaxID=189863 RepID=A0AAE3YIR8_9MICC|nr:preprotein translocase subunit SecE [Falsarthrobacter nasiphocae]MDR6892501.1 preprotein translocase subunit SecE [Falsarthrobacter nasiphocae]